MKQNSNRKPYIQQQYSQYQHSYVQGQPQSSSQIENSNPHSYVPSPANNQSSYDKAKRPYLTDKGTSKSNQKKPLKKGSKQSMSQYKNGAALPRSSGIVIDIMPKMMEILGNGVQSPYNKLQSIFEFLPDDWVENVFMKDVDVVDWMDRSNCRNQVTKRELEMRLLGQNEATVNDFFTLLVSFCNDKVYNEDFFEVNRHPSSNGKDENLDELSTEEIEIRTNSDQVVGLAANNLQRRKRDRVSSTNITNQQNQQTSHDNNENDDLKPHLSNSANPHSQAAKQPTPLEKNLKQNQNKLLEKLGVQDLRELSLMPIDWTASTVGMADELSLSRSDTAKMSKFSDFWDLKEILGAGSFGLVASVVEISTQRKLALKIAEWDQQKPSDAVKALQREYNIMSQIRHPNIIRVYEREQRFANYYIMEMDLGGETLDSFYKRQKLTEEQCSQIMKGIFSALKCLHDDHNVIHRDLKPDNIVMGLDENSDGDYTNLSKVKLIDFGLAVEYSAMNIKDFPYCGTMLFKPPEQVLQNYGYAKKADIWAAGIILHYLLTKEHPLHVKGDGINEMKAKLRAYTKITLKPHHRMSKQAEHLLQVLTEKTLSARIQASQSLRHPWITRKLKENLPLNHHEQQELDMKKEQAERKFRKVLNTLFVCGIQKGGREGQAFDFANFSRNAGKQVSSSSNTTQDDTVKSIDSYKQLLLSFADEPSSESESGNSSQSGLDMNDSLRGSSVDASSCSRRSFPNRKSYKGTEKTYNGKKPKPKLSNKNFQKNSNSGAKDQHNCHHKVSSKKERRAQNVLNYEPQTPIISQQNPQPPIQRSSGEQPATNYQVAFMQRQQEAGYQADREQNKFSNKKPPLIRTAQKDQSNAQHHSQNPHGLQNHINSSSGAKQPSKQQIMRLDMTPGLHKRENKLTLERDSAHRSNDDLNMVTKNGSSNWWDREQSQSRKPSAESGTSQGCNVASVRQGGQNVDVPKGGISNNSNNGNNSYSRGIGAQLNTSQGKKSTSIRGMVGDSLNNDNKRGNKETNWNQLVLKSNSSSTDLNHQVQQRATTGVNSQVHGGGMTGHQLNLTSQYHSTKVNSNDNTHRNNQISSMQANGGRLPIGDNNLSEGGHGRQNNDVNNDRQHHRDPNSQPLTSFVTGARSENIKNSMSSASSCKRGGRSFKKTGEVLQFERDLISNVPPGGYQSNNPLNSNNKSILIAGNSKQPQNSLNTKNNFHQHQNQQFAEQKLSSLSSSKCAKSVKVPDTQTSFLVQGYASESKGMNNLFLLQNNSNQPGNNNNNISGNPHGATPHKNNLNNNNISMQYSAELPEIERTRKSLNNNNVGGKYHTPNTPQNIHSSSGPCGVPTSKGTAIRRDNNNDTQQHIPATFNTTTASLSNSVLKPDQVMVVTGTSPAKRKHSSYRENRATKTAGSQIIGQMISGGSGSFQTPHNKQIAGNNQYNLNATAKKLIDETQSQQQMTADMRVQIGRSTTPNDLKLGNHLPHEQRSVIPIEFQSPIRAGANINGFLDEDRARPSAVIMGTASRKPVGSNNQLVQQPLSMPSSKKSLRQ